MARAAHALQCINGTRLLVAVADAFKLRDTSFASECRGLYRDTRLRRHTPVTFRDLSSGANDTDRTGAQVDGTELFQQRKHTRVVTRAATSTPQHIQLVSHSN